MMLLNIMHILKVEGDKSLAYSRQAHIEFFESYYAELGIPFDESEIIVCEEFKLLYVYNNERYIVRTASSILLQTQQRDNLCLTVYRS